MSHPIDDLFNMCIKTIKRKRILSFEQIKIEYKE